MAARPGPRPRPKAILCDVNETLFSMEAFRPRLKEAGLTQDSALELWFTSTLRDGISLAATGQFATFRDIAAHNLLKLRAKSGSTANFDDAIAHVLAGFEEVAAHSDVVPGLTAIHNSGVQVGTLTNGSKAVTQKFLDRSNLAFVGPVLDVEGPRAWKPSKDVYLYAVRELGLQPSEVMLAAVHPWDCAGAKSCGLQAAFIARCNEQFPTYFPAPDFTAASFELLAEQLR